MRTLGISAFYHDSSAALIEDGKIVAAAQEERFTRRKHDADFPHRAIEYCLREGGVQLAEVDYVVFYDKPFLKFERLMDTALAFAPKGFKSFAMSMPVWLKEKLFQKGMVIRHLKTLAKDFDTRKLLFTEHHQAHAASAFYPSPFQEAVVLTMDGVGEWTTTSVAIGRGHDLKIIKEIHFPHSIGLLYSAFTYYTGFKVNSGEYKLMGLAPYGEPKYTQLILDHLIDLREDGSYALDLSYFGYCTGDRMITPKFEQLFGAPARLPEELLTQFHMDIAASIQDVTEKIVLAITGHLAKTMGISNLCLAGGVALNCVANGKIEKSNQFKNIWVQPASGDAGGAVGAALAAYYIKSKKPRVVDAKSDGMRGSYLGPQFAQTEIEQRLKSVGAEFTTLSEQQMLDFVVSALEQGKAIGWFQGRMEFGPRALGARSIIGDARSASMQKTLNLKVKYRESFRPFAPAVLAEDVHDWFEFDTASPYMLMVAQVQSKHRRQMSQAECALFGIDKLNVARSSIPAVTHVDYSARIQTVHQDTNPLFHQLLQNFKARTQCPVVVNTSFNVRGEPIVCTPEDAFRCFMGTDIEVLVVGQSVMEKEKQKSHLKADYKDQFQLD